MKASSKIACLFFVLLIVVGDKAHGQGANFYIKNNDRVLFYGDSITEQSVYTNFVETYIVTRFPGLKVDFINSGWSGDKIWGGDGGSLEERLKRDVFPHQPTVMTAMLGMNDGCYEEFDPKCFQPFTEYYEKFLVLLKKDSPHLRLTLLQPSPFDDWTDSSAWRLAPPIKSGYNNVIVRYGEFVKELALRNKLGVSDMNGPLVDVIQRAQRADRDLAQKIIPDRIHPGTAGGLVMAAVLLKSWNAPSLVASVEFDAAAKKIVRLENSKITKAKFDKYLSWRQTDGSLPLPLDISDKPLVLVVFLSNLVDILNRQMLKVTNLNAAHYNLTIDGLKVAEYTKEELERGVNLSVLPTPMVKQAMDVHRLTQQHNKVHFIRWRDVQVPFEKDGLANTPTTLAGLDAIEAELVKRQRAAAQPRPHRFELIPQK